MQNFCISEEPCENTNADLVVKPKNPELIITSHEKNMIIGPYKARDHLYGINEAGGGEEALVEESNDKLGLFKRSRQPSASANTSSHSTKMCSKQTSATHLHI